MRGESKNPNERNRATRRRGVVFLEFILAFLVIVIATVGMLELTILAVVDQTVRTAALEGVREAAKGATDAQVARRVDEIVGIHEIAGVTATTPDVHLLIEDATTSVALGDTSIPCSSTGLPLAGTTNVRVTVCTRVNGPVPDLLGTLGFSLSGRVFQSSVEAGRE